MIFTEIEYEEFIGKPMPIPLNKWYLRAITSIKKEVTCFNVDNIPIEAEDDIKHAIMLQIEYLQNNDDVISYGRDGGYSIDDYSINGANASFYQGDVSSDALTLVKQWFKCSQWIYRVPTRGCCL